MTLRGFLRGSLLSSVLGFSGLLGYSALHSIDYAEEAAYSDDLRRVQSVSAELNERVLKSRSALLTQYDPLVASLRDLRGLHERLERVPRFLGPEAALDIRSQLRESQAKLREKDDLVETFKSQNSVLQNSLRYFPILSNFTIDRARVGPEGDPLASRVQVLISAIMLFDTAADHESTARVVAAQQALSTARQAAQSLGLSHELELILAHSRIILERKPVTDGIVGRILMVPSSRMARELEKAYSLHYRSAIDHALLLRQILFGLALATVALGLTDVILRLRGSALVLEGVTAELRLANRALAREREKERELGELKTRFVSMTSHEFRTPLSVIFSSTELLTNYAHRWEVDRRMVHLERIRTAAGSMRRMLDDILLIGRAQAGMLRPSPSQLDLDGVCRHLMESLEHSPADGHTIRYTFEGDPQVTLDERLVLEVIGNLLSNALKYSPPGSEVCFDVVVKQAHCRFTIRDQGIGIPADDLPRLFESFFRAKNVDQIKGSGLGLAVVKKALDVQRGTIEVESRLGEGTQFVVHLPRVSTDEQSSGSDS